MKTPIFLLLFGMILLPKASESGQVQVRYLEGLTRGFMILRQTDGTQIADGESAQVDHAGNVTSHLLFRFKDGSTYEETTVFTQRGTFRLLSDHVVQKGPAFKSPLESLIDTTTGRVTVHYQDGGKEKVLNKRLKLPADVANGLIFTLVKDIKPKAVTTVSYVGVTPKPRLVKLVFTPEGEDTFTTGSLTQRAIHYRMKVDVGGVTGVVAPVIGKQPPDTNIWVFSGEAPSYAASEGPLYGDGPVWRIELVSPVRKDDGMAGRK